MTNVMQTQIPNEPIYFNGVMTTAWYMFFAQLSTRVNEQPDVTPDLAELLNLAQQLPANAEMATLSMQLEQLQQAHDVSIIPLQYPTTDNSIMLAQVPSGEVISD